MLPSWGAWSTRYKRVTALVWSTRYQRVIALDWSTRYQRVTALAWSTRYQRVIALVWSTRYQRVIAFDWSTRYQRVIALAWSTRYHRVNSSLRDRPPADPPLFRGTGLQPVSLSPEGPVSNRSRFQIPPVPPARRTSRWCCPRAD